MKSQFSDPIPFDRSVIEHLSDQIENADDEAGRFQAVDACIYNLCTAEHFGLLDDWAMTNKTGISKFLYSLATRPTADKVEAWLSTGTLENNEFGPWTVEYAQEQLEASQDVQDVQFDIIDLCLINLHLAEEAGPIASYPGLRLYKLKKTLYSLMAQSLTGSDGPTLAAQLQSYLETE